MSITNYSELQTAVSTWMHKGGLSAVIPDIIVMAESELNRRLLLKSMNEISDISTSTTSREVTFPSSMIELKSLAMTYSDGSQLEITQVPRDDLIDFINGTSGRPEAYSVTDVIEFNRISDVVYTVKAHYLKGFSLSVAEPTNWLLTNHPDVYLYASLAEASSYLGNTSKIAIWTAKRDKAIAEVIRKEARSSETILLTDTPATAFMGYQIERGW